MTKREEINALADKLRDDWEAAVAAQTAGEAELRRLRDELDGE
jgi:hypothetical protein